MGDVWDEGITSIKYGVACTLVQKDDDTKSAQVCIMSMFTPTSLYSCSLSDRAIYNQRMVLHLNHTLHHENHHGR